LVDLSQKIGGEVLNKQIIRFSFNNKKPQTTFGFIRVVWGDEK